MCFWDARMDTCNCLRSMSLRAGLMEKVGEAMHNFLPNCSVYLRDGNDFAIFSLVSCANHARRLCKTPPRTKVFT